MPSAKPITDKIPFFEKCAFGIGCLFRAPGLHGLNQLSYPIFNVALGVNPVLIGLAVGIFRIWDAVTDPLMGVISDNSKNATGRRKPFILLGAILAGLIFPVVFWVPAGWSEHAIFGYFLVTSLAYYTAFTVYATPLWAIAFERTADYRERTVLWSYYSFFAAVGFAMFGWIYPLTQIDYWESTVEGVRYISIAIGLFWIGCGIVPAIFMKERHLELARGQEKIPFFKGLKETLVCRPFLIINGIQLAILIGSGLVDFLGFYLNVYYVHGGDTKPASVIMGIGATGVVVVKFAVIPFIPYLSNLLGKNGLMYAVFTAFALVSCSKWFLFTPDAPMLQLVVSIGSQIPNVIFWTLAPSMVSDTCDWDEITSRQRREGLFSSVDQWINKTGVGLASGVTGLILVATGFRSELGGGQSSETIQLMRILYTAVPICFYALAIYLLSKYPINEAKAEEIRLELERRRGAL